MNTDLFKQAIEAAGLPPPTSILADGKVHRFSTNGKGTDDSGWYVLFNDHIPAGSFGDWRSNTKENWCAKAEVKMTAKERAAYRKRIEKIQRERDEEEEQRHEEAAEQAERIWNNGRKVHDHPYLKRKQIKPHGVRLDLDSGCLLVPIRDAWGVLRSVQYIPAKPNGKKTFLKNSAVAGGYFTFGKDGDDTSRILIGEGFGTCASLHEAAGWPAFAALSASNLTAVASIIREMYPKATIIICADNDKSGIGQAKAKEAAEAVGGLVALPPEEGMDWNDVACRDGVEKVKQQIEAMLHSESAKHPGKDESRKTDKADTTARNPSKKRSLGNTGPFQIKDGKMVRIKMTKEGPIIVPLCNFVAQVTEEIALDDGAETTRAFLIAGALDDGTPLPPVRVPVAKFAAMNWPTDQWGRPAIVCAGSANKDYLREAIQRLSPDAHSRHVFTHTGWREINGRHIYLTAGGAIGSETLDEYEVDLGQELGRYCLPATPENEKAAMQASLRLLQLAPLTVTAPLWSGTFRAPLATAYPLDLSLWIEGPTGSLKSTLAALFLSHWGTFDRTKLSPWSSTVNQLERRSFLLKDALFVVDDWAPTALDQRELEMKAARLIRAQGNLAGRGRLRSDLSERPAYSPRGLIVSTGEQHPQGQSLLARTLLIELNKGEVNLAAVTEAQGEASRLPHCMSGYLRWLAPQMPSLPDVLRETFTGARARASMNGEHLRVPEALAQCWLGLHTGLQYAEEIGAVSPEEAQKLGDECWAALCEVGQAQGKLVEAERPTRRFLSVLVTILTQHKARIVPKYDDGDDVNKPDLLGWADEEFLYLLPRAVYRAVSIYCRESNEPFATSLDRLGRDFKVEGLSHCEEGRHTTNARVGTGQPRRVFKLDRLSVEQLLGHEVPLASVPDVPNFGG